MTKKASGWPSLVWYPARLLGVTNSRCISNCQMLKQNPIHGACYYWIESLFMLADCSSSHKLRQNFQSLNFWSFIDHISRIKHLKKKNAKIELPRPSERHEARRLVLFFFREFWFNCFKKSRLCLSHSIRDSRWI